jgi:hypothetical protein
MAEPRLQRLAEEILSLCGRRENREKEERHRAMLERASSFRPLVFARPLRTYIAQRDGLSLVESLIEPEKFLEMELLVKRSEAVDFEDDTWISPAVDIWLGVAFAPSLLGIPWEIREDTQAWIGEPILASLEDLQRLDEAIEGFDFCKTGMMGLAHEIWKAGIRLLGNQLSFIFPRWFAGNTRIALKVRGDTNFYMDFYDDPAKVRHMMSLITRMRRKYDTLYARAFPGMEPGLNTFSSYMKTGYILGNDEVDGNIFSADTYCTHILPSDLEYCRDHRRLYLHSCGNLTPMFPHLRELPNLMILHVSSQSDFAAAVETFGDRVIYEKAFADWDPEFKAIAQGDRKIAEKYIALGKEKGVFFYFMVDVDTAGPEEVARIKRWLSLMRETVDSHYPKN